MLSKKELRLYAKVSKKMQRSIEGALKLILDEYGAGTVKSPALAILETHLLEVDSLFSSIERRQVDFPELIEMFKNRRLLLHLHSKSEISGIPLKYIKCSAIDSFATMKEEDLKKMFYHFGLNVDIEETFCVKESDFTATKSELFLFLQKNYEGSELKQKMGYPKYFRFNQYLNGKNSLTNNTLTKYLALCGIEISIKKEYFVETIY